MRRGNSHGTERSNVQNGKFDLKRRNCAATERKLNRSVNTNDNANHYHLQRTAINQYFVRYRIFNALRLCELRNRPRLCFA